MLSLNAPSSAALETYMTCANGVRDANLKARLLGATESDAIVDADSRYAAAGVAGNHDTLAGADFQMPTVSPTEMVWLYEKRLAGRTSRGRRIYDALKQIAPYGRCALCGVRDATTLDHYLPKTGFPSLAVNPLNLIPACGRCNQLKSSHLSTAVHAYFDDLNDAVWLAAEVVESNPCVVLFALNCPSGWPANLANRARKHFVLLQLGELFSAQASRTMRGDAVGLRRAFDAVGPSGVRASLKDRADSWGALDPNCWEAAMYKALSASDWFCDGGFEIH